MGARDHPELTHLVTWLIPTGAGEVTELKPAGVENVVACRGSQRIAVELFSLPMNRDTRHAIICSTPLRANCSHSRPKAAADRSRPMASSCSCAATGQPPNLFRSMPDRPSARSKDCRTRIRLIQVTADGTDVFVANLQRPIRKHLSRSSGQRRAATGQDAGNARPHGRVRRYPCGNHARRTVLRL